MLQLCTFQSLEALKKSIKAGGKKKGGKKETKTAAPKPRSSKSRSRSRSRTPGRVSLDVMEIMIKMTGKPLRSSVTESFCMMNVGK